ncbi:MAG: phosphoglucosamine mutase [Gammaproteobacteria bacterium]|nr:phosphoglucosamine mutase [Gammaproteobacteria bacterium]MBT3488361.1 phosphoglucosamine mutase [Gammaproteobacteria bacterium]MBT3719448.1 phosphoglucosamine mutase [Gammaproteobacteria bacterium]MBT3845605.1 phosphoglucosamine mutase [Gammaproteobacteria bacterium]MBT3894135.1 phosphoglucosamine mutase [Gammaproteobacteria bacterium]
MSRKFFGTDGVRGRVGEHPITPDFVMRLGYAAGKVLAREGDGMVLIGKDTRISGYMFESALEAGFSAAGMDIGLLGPMPTPAVAYLTRTLRAKAGIVISASHNPFYDNGFKFFSAEGKKLPDQWEHEVESLLDEPIRLVESVDLGKARRVEDAQGRYIEFCKGSVPAHFSLSGMRIVVDCANGATYATAPHVFEELGADVIVIGAQPDGININHQVGSTHPQLLADLVKHHEADLGVALDGDGDRCILVDECGEVVDGDLLLYIIACSRQREGGIQGPVVGTLMTNLGLEHAFSRLEIPFMRAAVGDRYVLELLQQHQGLLGGESSGHLICLDRTTTGDGIVSALQVLYELVESGKPLSEWSREVARYPQQMINVVLRERSVNDSPAIQQALKEVERRLAERGRVLLRASGTEPLVRVMVEGEDSEEVEREVKWLSDIVQQEVGEI